MAVDVPLNVAALSAARGTLMYRTGRTVGLRRLVWFDRAGKPLGDVGDTDPSAARAPELSPDGRQIVLDRSVTGNTDVWRLDVERGVRTRLTFDSAPDAFAVWSPEGSRLVFSSARAGVYDMYTKSASGSGAEETLLKSDRNKIPLNWTPDGSFLLYRVSSIGSYDLFALPMNGTRGDRTPVPVATSSFDEREGQFSPDGKWIAYQSNESGTFEIYVQPFPKADGRWQVSQGGGVQVRWHPGGHELFYRDSTAVRRARFRQQRWRGPDGHADSALQPWHRRGCAPGRTAAYWVAATAFSRWSGPTAAAPRRSKSS